MNLLEFFAKPPTGNPNCDEYKCELCGKPTQVEHDAELRKVGDKAVCEACYDLELSNLLEQHPPGLLGGRQTSARPTDDEQALIRANTARIEQAKASIHVIQAYIVKAAPYMTAAELSAALENVLCCVQVNFPERT